MHAIEFETSSSFGTKPILIVWFCVDDKFIAFEINQIKIDMNSLVSAGYGSSGDSTDDENTIQTTNFQSNDVKNFLRSASDSENDSNDDEDSNSSTERSKSMWFINSDNRI